MSFKQNISYHTTSYKKIITSTGQVLIGSIMMAISAQITIPFPFVPFTAQTLVFLFIVLSMTPKLALLTILTYLAEGASGLPVFSHGSGTLLHLLGPTGGYLWGMVPASLLVSYLVSKNSRRSFVNCFIASTCGIATIFTFGLIQLSLFVSQEQLLIVGFLPFVLGELIKITSASLILPNIYKNK